MLVCWPVAGEPPPSGQVADSNGLPFTQDWSGTGVRILGEMPSSVQQAGLDFSEKVSQAGQRSAWLGGDRVQVRHFTTLLAHLSCGSLPCGILGRSNHNEVVLMKGVASLPEAAAMK